MEDILAIILIFGGGAACAIAFSPIGRAVADRIRGKVSGSGDDLRAELTDHKETQAAELEAMRRGLGGLGRRMGLAQRPLAQRREQRPGAAAWLKGPRPLR